MADYQVAWDGLEALLESLPMNTAQTPYSVELTSVTADFLRASENPGSLGDILSHDGHYVALSFGPGCSAVLSELTSASYMFGGCTSLESVDVSGMSNVTDASSMFYHCTSLVSVDVSGMSSVTDASYMFYHCTSLVSVDVSGMSSLTDVRRMFESCYFLVSVDVSGMSNVTDASLMFSSCYSLVEADVSSMSSVTKTTQMFYDCDSLVSVDASGMSNVTNASYMFYDCDSLVEADVSGMSNVTNVSDMFRNCAALERIDAHGMSSLGQLPFSPADHPNLHDVDISGMTSLTDLDEAFKNCTSLTRLKASGLTGVTTARSLCYGCTSLVEADVSGMSNVTNAERLFESCKKLAKVNVSGMTKNRYLWAAFRNTKLTSVDLSDFTSVTNAGALFDGCTDIQYVDMSTMTRLTTVQQMFKNASALKEVYGWSVPPSADIRDCFLNCRSLRTVYTKDTMPADAEWKVWDIRKNTGNSRSDVTIHAKDGTTRTVQVPASGAYTIEAVGKTDELLFSGNNSVSSSNISTMLESMVPLTTRTDVLPPDDDNFILRAKDVSKFRTNLPLSGFVNNLSSINGWNEYLVRVDPEMPTSYSNCVSRLRAYMTANSLADLHFLAWSTPEQLAALGFTTTSNMIVELTITASLQKGILHNAWCSSKYGGVNSEYVYSDGWKMMTNYYNSFCVGAAGLQEFSYSAAPGSKRGLVIGPYDGKHIECGLDSGGNLTMIAKTAAAARGNLSLDADGLIIPTHAPANPQIGMIWIS